MKRYWYHIEAFGLMVVMSLLFVLPTNAQFNPEINYQGKLTDSSGVAVPDGTYQMVFRLYTAPTGGTAIWTETLSGANEVSVANGLFSVMLGSTSALTAVDFNQTLYLGVTIESDSEMTPRKVLGAVPAAFVAEEANNAATVGGVASSSFVRSDQADSIAATTASTLLSITQSGTGNILDVFDGASSALTILDGGNVGIGTSTPSQRLSIGGNAYITGTITGATWGGSTIAATRGGTGLSTITQNQLLIGGAGNTWTQVATSSLGLGNGTFLGLTDTISSYNANRILYTTAGAVTDSANFTFDGTNLVLGTDVGLSRGAANRLDLATGDSLNLVSGSYQISGTDVLTNNTLGSGIVNSSLTSVGTLTSLAVSGTSTLATTTLASTTVTSLTLGVDRITDFTGTGLTVSGGALTVSTTSLTNLNATTLNNQLPSYYLDRANHTGTQLAATISDFSSTARGLFSSTATGLTYTSGTGVFSFTAGYNIPLTASTTNWNDFYTTPSNRITAGNHIDWTGNTLDVVTTGNWTGTFDGQEGSYYLDATNLNAGTLASARLSGAYSGITGLGTLTSLAVSGTSTFATTTTASSTIGTLNLTNALAVTSGGTGANNAASARTNLGATTVGANLFTLANPSALTLIRINADNSVSTVATSSLGLSASFSNSSQLAALLSNETGTGNAVFSASPTFTGTAIFANTGIQVGTSIPFSDAAGTLTLQNIDALDATTETTVEAAIDTLANLTAASSLATVGTITTGTWQGTAIGDAYLTKTGNWTGTFDGQEGSYYLDATNLNAGTLASARLSGAYSGITGLGTLTSLAVSGTSTFATTTTASSTIGTLNLTNALAVTSGGTGANNAASARTNLGATTVGANLFTLANPSALTLIRINADNSVSTVATSSLGLSASFSNSSQLAALLSNETGTGNAVFSASPTFTGTAIFANTGIQVGTSIPFSDAAGTLTLQNIDALDATTETTVEAAIDTLANLTAASSLATVGTITTGTWQGTAIGDAYLTKTGNWTGTFDGQEGSYYLDATNLNAGTLASARLSGAYSGITGLGTLTSLAVSGTSTFATTTTASSTIGTLNLTNALAVTSGGTGANNAASARTNLGATTVGANLFTLANPSALTLIRINADNSVSTVATSSLGLSASFSNSSQLAALLSNETGTGNAVFSASPTFTGTAIFANTGIQVGTSIPFSDAAGTLTLQNIDALDATTETTVEAAIDTLANLTAASSLATVGTITTGTWQGTAIGDAYLTKTGNWTGTFDGQEGSYYLDATNLNAGTLASARLSGAYSGITGLGTLTSLAVSGTSTFATTTTASSTIGTLNLTNALAVTSGGTGANNAASARTNLGATTVGANLFTLANPSALTLIRINADNSVSTVATSSLGLSASFSNSSQLAALLSNETGTGNAVFSASPTFTGTAIFANTGIQVGTSIPFSDAAGTLTLQNIDALDATTETTVEAAIDTLANLTAASSLATVGTITTGTWQGTAIGDAYLTKTGNWTGTFDGQEGSYYLDATNLNAGTLASARLSGAYSGITGLGTLTSLAVSGTSTFATTTTASSTIGTLNLTNALAVTSGGTGANNAASARTNLGATTVGANLFTLANPSALTLIRINADNSVSTVATSSLGLSASFSNSSQLAALLSNETGTGNAVFSASPTFTGTAIFANTGIQVGTSIPFSDAAGTLTLQNIDALDATTETTVEAAIDTLANLTAASSLATVGTITTGTWQGTAIGDAYLTKTGNWTGTFDGQEGTYYLSRANHTGTQATTTITGVFNATNGGTGLSTITQNQLLIGGAGNTWTQIATSSLGLSASFSNSSQLAALLSDETGTGNAVFSASPTFTGLTNFADLFATNATTTNATTTNLAISSLTSGRVPYVTTSGRLIDSANLTFNGTSLTFGTDAALSRGAANRLDLATGDSLNLILGNIAFNGTNMINASTTNDSYTFGELAGATFNGGTTNNIAIGFEAGRYASTTSADQNIYIGKSAGSNNTGSYNIIMSDRAAQNNKGSYNFIVGGTAGMDNTGSENNFIGYGSGAANTGSHNNYLGLFTGTYNTGNFNDFIGYSAGASLRSTSSVLFGSEVFVGQIPDAPFVALNNTAVGYRAGYNATNSADNNILIGYQAADNLTTGNNNIIIGYDIDNVTATTDNALNIGNLIFGTGIDGTGTTLSNGNIGIGTSSPTSKLTVAGDFRLTGAFRDSTNSAGTSGMILQSTGTGTGWVATSSLGLAAASDLASYLPLTGGTLSGNLTFSGSSANIALGSNYLSGDGGDEGLFVNSFGEVTIGSTTTAGGLLQIGSVYYPSNGARALNIDAMIVSSSTTFHGVATTPTFAPLADLTSAYGIINRPTFASSSNNITNAFGTYSRFDTAADYTGTITNGYSYFAGPVNQLGTNPVTNYYHYFASNITNGSSSTSGTIENAAFWSSGLTAEAGSGGSVTNYGLRLTQPSGNTTGTNNYGIYISGSGGASASNNYSFYNASAANSYFSGNVGIGSTTPTWRLSVTGQAAIDGPLRVMGVSAFAGRILTGGVTSAYNAAISLGGTHQPFIQEHGTARNEGSTALFVWANNAAGPELSFNKSRGAAIGTQTIVNNADVLGAMVFAGSDGTDPIPAASILGEVDGAPSTNDMPGRLIFNTTLDGASAPTERMRITNDGRVGIGTTSPSSLLSVGGTSTLATTSMALAIAPIYTSSAADVADAGVIRLGNAEVIGWEASPAGTDVTLTVNASEQFVFGGTGALIPAANDGAALGVSGTAFSDIFLATGAVLNFGASNVVMTHSTGVMTVGTGDLRITTAGTNAASVVTVGGTQTLTNKTLTSPAITGGSLNNTPIGATTANTAVFTNATTTNFAVTSLTAGRLTFATTSGRLVDAAGLNYNGTNLGIGTTTPADVLQVWGDIRVGTGTTGCVKDADGTTIAGTCSSDERLKTEITPLASSSKSYLEALIAIEPSTYYWNDVAVEEFRYGTTSMQTGLIAQQVALTMPEMVTEDYRGFKQVRFSDLPIYLLQAIKEMWSVVDGFKEKFTTKELCVGDTCVTEAELQMLLQNAQQQPSAPVSIPPTSAPDQNPSSDPATEGYDSGVTDGSGATDAPPAEDNPPTEPPADDGSTDGLGEAGGDSGN
jgi:hypothetical protein